MKRAHIIGICGVAMSAIAKLLQDQGYVVTGSDDEYYPPASDYVQKLGIDFKTGYSPDNIPDDVDLIVIGRNAKLDPKTNPEVQTALSTTAIIQSYPETLYELTKSHDKIVVAGSYGKSTITTLIAFVLMHAGKDPGYFIGAYPYDFEYTSNLGKDIFVMEGDEYPTSHTDNRAKFLHYKPQTVLLSSVDHDHVNVYPTYADYTAPFIELLKTMPEDGLLMACTDNDGVNKIGHESPARIVTYGIHHDAVWTGKNIQYGEITSFELRKDGVTIAELQTTLLGAHNIQNIVGVSALLLEKNLVTADELTDALRAFSGVRRRLNRITQKNAIPAYEGFGTSYEKARSAIEAIDLHYPNKDMIVLFEPHTFSWRNRDALKWYDDVFKEAKDVLVYHPASQGSDTHKQLSQKEIVDRINASGINAIPVETETEILNNLSHKLHKKSVLLILTSGNFDGALDNLPNWLNKLSI